MTTLPVAGNFHLASDDRHGDRRTRPGRRRAGAQPGVTPGPGLW